MKTRKILHDKRIRRVQLWKSLRIIFAFRIFFLESLPQFAKEYDYPQFRVLIGNINGARRTLKRDQIIYIYRCEEIKLGRKKAETKHRSRDWLVSTNEPLRFNDPCARRDRESNDSRKVITSGLKPMGKTMEIERLEKFFPRFKIPSLLLFPFPLRIHLVVSISFNVEKL